MWHEARRQERKIRVMMVDYQKRADRRRQFYEQIVCIAAVFLQDAVRNQFCCHKLMIFQYFGSSLVYLS